MFPLEFFTTLPFTSYTFRQKKIRGHKMIHIKLQPTHLCLVPPLFFLLLRGLCPSLRGGGGGGRSGGEEGLRLGGRIVLTAVREVLAQETCEKKQCFIQGVFLKRILCLLCIELKQIIKMMKYLCSL